MVVAMFVTGKTVVVSVFAIQVNYGSASVGNAGKTMVLQVND